MRSLQPRVFVQQADRRTRSAEEIISKLVISVEGLRRYFTADDYSYLRAFESRGPLLMRGAESGSGDRNRKVWEQMEIGDLALIAWHGHIEAAGEIVMCKDSPDLAKARNNGRYHFLYFLRNVEPLHIPYVRLNRVLTYKDGNAFQGFQGLDYEGSGAVLELLRALAPAMRIVSEPTLVDGAIEGEMDARSEINRRCEQGLLRRLYFGAGGDGRCGFCGRVFPIEFLVAAHIKKRAACSDEEKRDAASNIIPACRFGCDELFERGYILGVNGVFMGSRERPSTEGVDSYLLLIEGRTIEAWERRQKYFEWHAKRHS